MSAPYTARWSRREFIGGLTLAGTAGLLGLSSSQVAAEPPPETSKIRLVHVPAICLAPIWVAQELLHAEGFTDVEYVTLEKGTGPGMLADGRADISMWDALSTFQPLDTGKPIVVVAGMHAGCWELFGHGGIQTIRDLKGKTVAIQGIGAGDHVLLSSMLAYVGMAPHRDVAWVEGANMADAMRLFIEGQADAFMGFAPQPQELRAKKVGHVIVDTAQDRPWSQYFCCLVTVRRDFARQHPEATKRALRALLKAADICSAEPERVARQLVAQGYEPRYEVSLEVLKALPYNRWRQSNPEDTLRFYALRLHEVEMIKSTPQKLIAQGTDWGFLNELKRELKG
jgi:NitT/TauT family transport system substrate-binding protein